MDPVTLIRSYSQKTKSEILQRRAQRQRLLPRYDMSIDATVDLVKVARTPLLTKIQQETSSGEFWHALKRVWKTLRQKGENEEVRCQHLGHKEKGQYRNGRFCSSAWFAPHFLWRDIAFLPQDPYYDVWENRLSGRSERGWDIERTLNTKYHIPTCLGTLFSNILREPYVPIHYAEKRTPWPDDHIFAMHSLLLRKDEFSVIFMSNDWRKHPFLRPHTLERRGLFETMMKGRRGMAGDLDLFYFSGRDACELLRIESLLFAYDAVDPKAYITRAEIQDEDKQDSPYHIATASIFSTQAQESEKCHRRCLEALALSLQKPEIRPYDPYSSLQSGFGY